MRTEATPVNAEAKSARLARFWRFIADAPQMLSRHLWVWPLLAALVLGAVGFWVRTRVEGATRAELASRLQTLLNADVAALRLWFSEREADARSVASDLAIQEDILQLVEIGRTDLSEEGLVSSEPARKLAASLK